VLASRLAGLARQKTIAHFLGQSTPAADALAAAFRIPNVVQNLLGEGAMSASFVPEYARLIKSGNTQDAERLKNGLLGLLALAVTIVAALGVLAAPVLVDLLVPGFEGARRSLAITATRVLFPSVGLLAISAWCIGVLNTHRRFFLSYAAPVVWNAAIIGALFLGADRSDGGVIWAAWGALLGSSLQLLVQLPTVIRVAGAIRPIADFEAPGVRTVLERFGPAVLSRGVVQIGAFIDTWLASWLPIGAVATLANAQLLYTLPLSLFVVSVTAAILPALAEDTVAGAGPSGSALVGPLRQMAFFVVPSTVALVALGGHIGGLVYRSGAFTAADLTWLHATMGAAALGLVPQASARLYATAHFAFGDTVRPLRFAILRLVVSTSVGAALALFGPRWLGLDPKFGTVGLALGWVLGGLVEWRLLRRSVRDRGLQPGTDRGFGTRVWVAAIVAGGAGWGVGAALGGAPAWVAALAALVTFAAGYGAVTIGFALPEAHRLLPARRR